MIHEYIKMFGLRQQQIEQYLRNMVCGFYFTNTYNKVTMICAYIHKYMIIPVIIYASVLTGKSIEITSQ